MRSFQPLSPRLASGVALNLSFRRGDPGESASTLQSGNKADANNGGPESHGCKRFMQTIDISRSNVMDVLFWSSQRQFVEVYWFRSVIA